MTLPQSRALSLRKTRWLVSSFHSRATSTSLVCPVGAKSNSSHMSCNPESSLQGGDTHQGVHKGVSSASPQEGSIKAKRVKVITHTIATPLLAATRIAHIALGVGPANAQMWWQVWWLFNVVQCHLKVPPLVQRWPCHLTHKDVGPGTVRDTSKLKTPRHPNKRGY